MGTVNEQLFEMPDHRDLNYSMVEYDLYAKLGMSIRKNLRTGIFEIFRLDENRTVVFTGSLQEVVQEANRLEGAENTIIAKRTGVLAVN